MDLIISEKLKSILFLLQIHQFHCKIRHHELADRLPIFTPYYSQLNLIYVKLMYSFLFFLSFLQIYFCLIILQELQRYLSFHIRADSSIYVFKVSKSLFLRLFNFLHPNPQFCINSITLIHQDFNQNISQFINSQDFFLILS